MTKLIWLDLETTGLDPQKDRILELSASEATLADPLCRRFVYGQVFKLNRGHPLSDFILDMHTKNGLLEECYNSQVSLVGCEEFLLKRYPEVEKEERPILAGSTIHFDMAFLKFWMPRFAARLSHRLYDVSAIKLFCQSLGMPKLPKAEAHRATEDVLESIEHARSCVRWLRLNGFAPERYENV
jgi:oligoribonuclease